MENMWFTENVFLDFKNKTFIFVNQDNRRRQKPFPVRQWRVCNLINYLASNKTKTRFSVKELREAIWGGRGKEIEKYTIDDVRHVTQALRDLFYDKDDTRRKSFLVLDQDYVYFDPPLDKPPPDNLEPKETGQSDMQLSEVVEPGNSGQQVELSLDDLNPEESGQTAAERLQLATDKLNNLIAEWARDVTGQSETLPPDNLEPEGSGQPDELPPVDLEPEESGQTDELPLDDLEPNNLFPDELNPTESELSENLLSDGMKSEEIEKHINKLNIPSTNDIDMSLLHRAVDIGFGIKILLISMVGILLYNLVPLIIEDDETGVIIRPSVYIGIKLAVILMIIAGIVGFFTKDYGQTVEALVLKTIAYKKASLDWAKCALRRFASKTRIRRIVRRFFMISVLAMIYVLISNRMEQCISQFIDRLNQRNSTSESSEVASEESTSEESVSEESVSEESVSEESVSEESVSEESVSEEITDFKLDKTSLILTTDMAESQYQLGVWINDFHLKLGWFADDASKAAWMLLEQDFEWSSSDPTVATVSEEGLVEAKNEGDATITAFYNGYSAVCDVSVKNGMWSDWSGWTAEPIMPSDSVEVETKIWDEDTTIYDMVCYKTWADGTMEVQYRNYSIGDNYEFYGLSKPMGERLFRLHDVTESYLKHAEIVSPGAKQSGGYLGVNKSTVDGYSMFGVGAPYNEVFFIENICNIEANNIYYRFREVI